MGKVNGGTTVTRERLVDDFARLGLSRGNAVLVHSSLSRLGWVDGGAATVVDALLEAVGPSGTVLFPTLTGAKKDGPAHPPVMDVRHTPCWTGAIPEEARQRPGAVRSLHPTHSVTALGADADRWVAGHERGATPCDEHSPYVRLMDEGGKILLLGGVTHESNTSLHALEELAGVPYHLQDRETEGIVALPDGRRAIVRNRLHLWRNHYHTRNMVRDFEKIQPYLVDAGAITEAAVGASTSRLMGAGELRDIVLPLLMAEPLFLLSEDGSVDDAAT